MPIVIETGSLVRRMDIGPDITDLTEELNDLVGRSEIVTGTLSATAIGSTASLTTIEFEPGVLQDLKRAIEELAPPGCPYEHEKRWHDGNGHSHVQAALLGPSLTLPVREGRLGVGTWQQVVLINHDNRCRSRTVEVTLIGATD